MAKEEVKTSEKKMESVEQNTGSNIFTGYHRGTVGYDANCSKYVLTMYKWTRSWFLYYSYEDPICFYFGHLKELIDWYTNNVQIIKPAQVPITSEKGTNKLSFRDIALFGRYFHDK